MEPSDVVLVLLHGVERYSERQVSESDMRTTHLADGHLVLFEGVIVHVLLQRTQQHFVGHHILFRKASGWNGCKARDKGLVALMLGAECGQRAPVQAIV